VGRSVQFADVDSGVDQVQHRFGLPQLAQSGEGELLYPLDAEPDNPDAIHRCSPQ